MKVDSEALHPNGYLEHLSVKLESTTPVSQDAKAPRDVEEKEAVGTTLNGCVSGGISEESLLSISDINSDDDDEATLSPTVSDEESLDVDIQLGGEVCHGASLEVLLENMDCVPGEVRRMLKLIGLLDEKCEEITELLDRPCEDWFALHRTKKQRKSQVPEPSMNGDVAQSINGTKEMMIYKKIYEEQDGIEFETYKARLAKARKMERQRLLEARRHEMITLPDNELKILYDKGQSPSNSADMHDSTVEDEVEAEASNRQPEMARTTEGTQRPLTSELFDDGKRPKLNEDDAMSIDIVDSYFRQMEQQTLHSGDFMDMDKEGSLFDEGTMGEEWKDRLDEILHEHQLNHLPNNDMEALQNFMDHQLSLLWRYTLRKKALSRKLYEMVVHHYVSVIQEMDPDSFAASLRCHPEAELIQGAMLNELEEQYMSPEEMTELFKDVEALMSLCDDGYRHQSIPDPTPAPKQEDSASAPFGEAGRKLLMDESFKATSASRQPVNGAASVYSPSSESPRAFGEGPSTADGQSRHVRNKRHKPAKATSTRYHAAKSPQFTGRLLTHRDISTAEEAEKLKGHQAELFWPDDNLWYLIKIEVINPETKKASIAYTTGEIEPDLELTDVVRQGHMSLLADVEETDLSAEEEVGQQTADVEMPDEVASELSASEVPGMYMGDNSADDDEMCTDDDEEEAMANIRNRGSRRGELKSENLQQKSS